MKFEQKEMNLIEICIKSKIDELNKLVFEWESYEWDKIKNLKTFFANEKAFNETKSNWIKYWSKQLKELNNLRKKIDENF